MGYTISYGIFQPPFATYSGKQSAIGHSLADSEYLVYGSLMEEVDWLLEVCYFLDIEVSEVIV